MKTTCFSIYRFSQNDRTITDRTFWSFLTNSLSKFASLVLGSHPAQAPVWWRQIIEPREIDFPTLLPRSCEKIVLPRRPRHRSLYTFTPTPIDCLFTALPSYHFITHICERIAPPGKDIIIDPFIPIPINCPLTILTFRFHRPVTAREDSTPGEDISIALCVFSPPPSPHKFPVY